MNILDTIVAHKKEEVASAKQNTSIKDLQEHENFYRPTFSLKKSLDERSGIIAEFKRKSPSKGQISTIEEPLAVVAEYQKFRASGISILTDSHFFGGSSADIIKVRKYLELPILRKDFMIDEYQFYEAKAMGADVVLLIAACLSPAQTLEFTELAHSLGLEVLLEIHTEEELKHFNPSVDLVGINNRNLKDFKVDLQHSVALKNQLPKEVPSVAESGIYSVDDFRFLKEKGFHGFLMGEYFMKNKNPGLAFQQFIQAIK